jgi:hypothetical protein
MGVVTYFLSDDGVVASVWVDVYEVRELYFPIFWSSFLGGSLLVWQFILCNVGIDGALHVS